MNTQAKTIPFPGATSDDASASEISKLCERHSAAKNKAKVVAAEIAGIEQRLVEIVGVQPEGAFSVVVEDRFKVTTTGKVNRTVDTGAVQEAWPLLPFSVQEAFSFKAGINMKQMRALESVSPELYARAAAFITAKPGKPSVEIKPIEPSAEA